MIISKKRQYQDTASIREPGRCRPDFCDEPVDHTSRDPKLGARRNLKFLSHFRLIGQENEITASRASASAQSSSEADCHWETMATKSKQSLAHKRNTVVYDLSATDYCI